MNIEIALYCEESLFRGRKVIEEFVITGGDLNIIELKMNRYQDEEHGGKESTHFFINKQHVPLMIRSLKAMMDLSD